MSATAETTDIRKMVASLGRVAELWLNPQWRRPSVTALQVATGFPRVMIENALNAAFEELTAEKISSYMAHEPAFLQSRSGPKRVLHIAAGNVFTAWLPGAVLSLLLGSECDIKPSSQEMLFASLWRRSIKDVDPLMAKRIQVVRWSENLVAGYPAVVAYGSDGTLHAIRAQIAAGTRFVGYGHKFSVAVIWKEALTAGELPDLVSRLEKDVAPFNLEGCLSPQRVYVEAEDPGLFEALFTRVNVMPTFKRFGHWADLREELRGYVPDLSTFGFAGPYQRIEAIQTDLTALGFSRVCEVGEMQQPPLSWRNGGISLAESLCRHPGMTVDL